MIQYYTYATRTWLLAAQHEKGLPIVTVESPASVADRQEVAGKIQSTLYHIGVTRPEVIRTCEECMEYGFNAAMVPARWVRTAAEVLRGTTVLVASAVDFPLGMMTSTGRLAEACALVSAGADEIDLGLPIGLVKECAYAELQAEVEAVVRVVAPIPIKVMLELPLMTLEQRNIVVDVCVAAGVAYVKNASSGAIGVATPEQIAYLRARVPGHVGVKASGGIKSFEQVLALLAAGADLVGTSDAVSIVIGAAGGSSAY